METFSGRLPAVGQLPSLKVRAFWPKRVTPTLRLNLPSNLSESILAIRFPAAFLSFAAGVFRDLVQDRKQTIIALNEATELFLEKECEFSMSIIVG